METPGIEALQEKAAVVADYFGLNSSNYQIIDTEEDQVQHQYSRGMAQYTIAKSWRDADFRISFPKLRSHPVLWGYKVFWKLLRRGVLR